MISGVVCGLFLFERGKMFDLGLGVSIDAVTGVMDYETIGLLEKSSVSTFEWSPWCFWTDYDGVDEKHSKA